MVYKLKLLKLHCYLPDESDGDEIYILMNGKQVWPVDERYETIVVEETRLDLAFEINKGDKIAFELWDYDLITKDDLLGKLSIEATAHGNYVTDFVKTGTDKSKYALAYELG